MDGVWMSWVGRQVSGWVGWVRGGWTDEWRTRRNAHHMSRTPRNPRGTRKSRRTWNQTACPQVQNSTTPGSSTLSSLLMASPTPYPRPGLNLPMGPGGPGGPAGPWGQWLLVSVKVLDRNGSPGGERTISKQGGAARGGGRQTVSTCLFCQASFNCCAPVGQFVGYGWGHRNLRQGGWWGKCRLHRTRLQGDLGSNCHSLAADIQQDSTSLNLDCHRSDGNNNESYH